MSVDTCIEDPPTIHQPDHFDLCQGHSSNRRFQWESVGFHLNMHLVLDPLAHGTHIIPIHTSGEYYEA